MKYCFRCERELPLEQFYQHKGMADGLLNKCKDCTKRDSRKQYVQKTNEPDWVLLERKRQRLKEKAARDQGRRKKRKDNKAQKAWIIRNPQKRKAHSAVSNAIRDGRLSKQPCEKCGDEKVEAHHDDYSKPLNVRWFCLKHHNEYHTKLREEQFMVTITQDLGGFSGKSKFR